MGDPPHLVQSIMIDTGVGSDKISYNEAGVNQVLLLDLMPSVLRIDLAQCNKVRIGPSSP